MSASCLCARNNANIDDHNIIVYSCDRAYISGLNRGSDNDGFYDELGSFGSFA